MSTSAIAKVVPRKPTVIVGRVTNVVSRVRPWVRFEVDLSDRTGTITLRFMGRSEIPGMVLGRKLGAEGTPGIEGDRLVMLNPRYVFCREDPQPWRKHDSAG